MIAMALANDPALLIADEPTTALDVTIQAQILDLLAEQKAKRGLALLLISHDFGLVRRHADRVCVMKDGKHRRIRAHGGYLRQPAAPVYAHAAGCRAQRPPRTRWRLTRRRSSPPAISRCSSPAPAACCAVPVATLRALDGVSLTVRAGETVGLVGESGSGKSTMGLAMLRLQAAEGRVAFLGRDLTGLSQSALRPLRAQMQIVFQDPYGSLSPRMSVGDIVAEGLVVHERLSHAERSARVAAALGEVGLPADAAERYPHEFSGGQRQRVAIARAIVLQPKLVVLDEPTSALDRSVQGQVIELLRGLQRRRGLAYLFISHDLAVIRAMAHRVVVLRAGRVVEEGPGRDAVRHPARRLHPRADGRRFFAA